MPASLVACSMIWGCEMEETAHYTAAILTVSTKGARGERDDASGQIVHDTLAGAGFAVAERAIVTDDRAEVAVLLRRWCDEAGYALIVTTGGTGLSPRDLT